MAVIFVPDGTDVRGRRGDGLGLGGVRRGIDDGGVVLPRLLARLSDRFAMALGAGVMTLVLLSGPLVAVSYPRFLALWVIMGFGYSLTIAPARRALRRSSNATDRPSLFAAQFALSHACWLIAYPVAGLVSAEADSGAAFLALAGLCALGAVIGLLIWPAHGPETVAHRHDDLAPDDPHLAEAYAIDRSGAHAHPFVIDERHSRWLTAKGWGDDGQTTRLTSL